MIYTIQERDFTTKNSIIPFIGVTRPLLLPSDSSSSNPRTQSRREYFNNISGNPNFLRAKQSMSILPLSTSHLYKYTLHKQTRSFHSSTEAFLPSGACRDKHAFRMVPGEERFVSLQNLQTLIVEERLAAYNGYIVKLEGGGRLEVNVC